MKKSELRKQNQYLERDIQNLVCHTFESAGIETAIRWKTYFDSGKSFVCKVDTYEKQMYPMDIVISVNCLDDESMRYFEEFLYPPDFITIKGFSPNAPPETQWKAVFVVHNNISAFCGMTRDVEITVRLKQSFLDEYKKKIPCI
jgi:hypothetical protein